MTLEEKLVWMYGVYADVWNMTLMDDVWNMTLMDDQDVVRGSIVCYNYPGYGIVT